MKLVVGLGNPGPRYARTRHNAGRQIVEAIADRAGPPAFEARHGGRFSMAPIAGEAVALLLPDTFMNESGAAVGPAAAALGTSASDVLVVVDDLDLPLGRLRVRASGRDGGQRGLRDVLRALGTTEVPRLRFGVSRPTLGVAPLDWVLEEFVASEQASLEAAVDRAVEAVTCWVAEGVAAAMDHFNGPPPDTVSPG